MSDIVFILGAGASKEVNAPLMAEFLDEADSLRKIGKVPEAIEDFNRVFEARSRLQSVYSKSYVDLNNVESVFAAFEMAKTLGVFAEYKKSEIDNLIESMKILIVKTLEKKIKFKVKKNDIISHDVYNDFVNLFIYFLKDSEPKYSISVITFNYDIALDYALNNRIQYSYCLDGSINQRILPLLKLHGSLNWGDCPKCRKIVEWDFNRYMQKHRLDLVGKYQDFNEETIIPIGSSIQEYKHSCGNNLNANPIIVPPTWNKTEYHRSISKVWRVAANELSNAEYIFVIGYSYPESDYFFHYLYALGSIGNNTLKSFWVFDPNADKLKDHYLTLLGLGAKDRFEILPNTFSEAVKILAEYFKKKISIRQLSDKKRISRLSKSI